jgi:adenylate cyclase class IV
VNHPSPKSVLTELHQLGFDPFMTFHGFNQTGFYQPLDIDLKLMNCNTLTMPYIVEIEKTASNLEDAFSKEKDLQQILKELGLTNRKIKEEPPALFYATLSKN